MAGDLREGWDRDEYEKTAGLYDSPADGERLAIEGKTIATARYGKTAAGYDYISLLFSDGTVFRIREEGQTGFISFKLIEP